MSATRSWHARCSFGLPLPAGGNAMATRFDAQPDTSHRHTAASKGACYCGTVQYAIDGALETHAQCDCETCSQRPASSFAPVVAAQAAGFQWLQGAEWISTYDSPTLQRCFCRWCGSALPLAVQGTGLVFCPADTLGSTPRFDLLNRTDGSRADADRRTSASRSRRCGSPA